jgi:pyruvate dehydrogenase E1 component
VWSVTSYKALYTDALDAERWNLLHPDQEPRVPYVTRCLANSDAPVVAASDYVKALPESIARFIPGTLHSLGTDGYGRSETREALRDFFEVDRRYVALAALHGLARQGRAEPALVRKALQEMRLDPEKPNPFTC